MRGNAVIIIPSQGGDIAAFEAVARKLNSDVYAGKATIIRPKSNGKSKQKHTTRSFHPKVPNLRGYRRRRLIWGVSRSVMVSLRRAELAYGDGGHQPWDPMGRDAR
jgi:hypothetical protein